jgi:hypothetical protein
MKKLHVPILALVNSTWSFVRLFLAGSTYFERLVGNVGSGLRNPHDATSRGLFLGERIRDSLLLATTGFYDAQP